MRMELPCVLEEAVKTAGFGPLKAKQQEALVAFVSGKKYVCSSTYGIWEVHYICHFTKCFRQNSRYIVCTSLQQI